MSLSLSKLWRKVREPDTHHDDELSLLGYVITGTLAGFLFGLVIGLLWLSFTGSFNYQALWVSTIALTAVSFMAGISDRGATQR